MASRKPPESAHDKAYRVALSRLNRTAMSRSRLDTKLKAAGFEDDARAAALDRLERAGLLDDEAYTRALVAEFRRGGAGPALQRQKLRQRGIDATTIDRVLAQTHDADATLATARTFATQKLRSMQRLDPATQKRRLWAALARRGFDGDTIERTLAELLRTNDAIDSP